MLNPKKSTGLKDISVVSDDKVRRELSLVTG